MVVKDVLADALFRIADEVIANGINDGDDYRAARELLLGRSPRLSQGAFTQQLGENAVRFAVRIAPLLDCTVLAIQGPPGAGKMAGCEQRGSLKSTFRSAKTTPALSGRQYTSPPGSPG